MWDNPGQKEFLFMPVIKDYILICLDRVQKRQRNNTGEKMTELFLKISIN